MEIYGNVLKQDIKINRDTVVALGKFDGLHRGHRALIGMLAKAKKSDNMQAVAFAFTRSPKETLENESRKYILTSTEKRLFMEKSGIDILVECPVEEEILSMEPEDFIRDVLIEKLSVKKIFCGDDFRFGHKRRGDVSMLKELEKSYGYETTVIRKLQYGNREISSTYIREEIAAGNISLANELLGYPYTVLGVVTDGRKLGRTLGFPTANIIPEKDKLLPPNGVYCTDVIADDRRYRAVTNIGTKPTVNGDKNITIETNLLDEEIDLYGKTLELQFFEFVRPEKKFGSIEELKAAVNKDILICRKKYEVC